LNLTILASTTLAAFLVWQTPAFEQNRWPLPRIAGAVALVALAFLYRSGDASGLMQMRPHWWGILGLIGWAYLIAAGAFWMASGRYEGDKARAAEPVNPGPAAATSSFARVLARSGS
jgi:hypothetical protein